MIKSPNTPEKGSFLVKSEKLFSEKKYHEILEKSKEKNRYLQEEVKESEEESQPPFTSSDRSQENSVNINDPISEINLFENEALNKSLTNQIERLMQE